MSEWHFNGCSFSSDIYLENTKDSFAYIVGKHFSKNIRIKAIPGNNNHIIFNDAIDSLLDDTCETTFIQLSLPGRMTFYHYNNYMSSIDGKSSLDYLSRNRWKDFVDVYKLVDQEYNQYHLMSNYIPRINRIAQLTGKRVYFINGFIHIDPVFLNNESDINFDLMEKDTKRILDFENKDDNTINNQLSDIRDKLSVIDVKQWIMLYDTMEKLMFDLGTDNLHPGIKSNEHYAKLIIKHIERENGK